MSGVCIAPLLNKFMSKKLVHISDRIMMSTHTNVKGTSAVVFLDGDVIAEKDRCPHDKCLLMFTAHAAIYADSIVQFEKPLYGGCEN